MKILITTQNCNINGVNTFIFTLCEYLNNVHEISVRIREVDETSKFFKSLKALSKITINPILQSSQFDLILFNFTSDVLDVLPFFPHVKKKFIVHGLHNENFDFNVPVHEIVCLSKRQFDFVTSRGTVKYVKLAHNPIDGERFSLQPSKTRQKVLLFDYRENQILLTTVMAAASALGMYVSVLGRNDFMDASIWKVENKIKNSDIVIGYGRSLIEGMFMGKCGIVYGVNGGDGLVTNENFDDLVETSFSGWVNKSIPKPHETHEATISLFEELKKTKNFNPLRVSLTTREKFSMLKNIDLIIS